MKKSPNEQPNLNKNPFLIGISGAVAGKHEISELEFTVGRDDPNSDIKNNFHVSTDRAISRQHIKIFREGKDFFVEDLESLCGTYVNGQKIGEDTSSLLDHNSAYAEYKRMNKGKVKLNDGDIITLSKSVRNEEYSFVFSLDGKIDTGWKLYEERARRSLKSGSRIALRDIRRGMYLGAKENGQLKNKDFQTLFEKIHLALGTQGDRSVDLQIEIESYVKEAGLREVNFDDAFKQETAKLLDSYAKNHSEKDVVYMETNMEKLSQLAHDNTTHRIALAIICACVSKESPESLEWAVEEIKGSLPYTAPEAIYYRWGIVNEEVITKKKKVIKPGDDYLDLRLAAAQAYDLSEKGKKINGILVKEDTFFNFYKSELGFGGVIGITSPSGRVEFYVRPITESQQVKLGIDSMGKYGITFTPLTKDQLEDKLK